MGTNLNEVSDMLYTDEHLQENPDSIHNMSEFDVDEFITQYKGKRKILSRDDVVMKKREFIVAEKLRNTIETKKPLTMKRIKKIMFILSYPDAVNDVWGLGRTISNEIHDLPKIWTGYQSQASIESEKFVYEHFYPRQHAGEFIVEEYIRLGDDFTISYLVELIRQFCSVHKTTKKENEDLMKYQTKENLFKWKKSYKKAVSKMIQVSTESHWYDLMFEEILSDLK